MVLRRKSLVVSIFGKGCFGKEVFIICGAKSARPTSGDDEGSETGIGLHYGTSTQE